MKTQRHENKNASSKLILIQCEIIVGNAMLGCLDNHIPDDEKHQSSGLLE